MRKLLDPITPEEARRRAEEAVLADVEPWRGASQRAHAEGLLSVLRFADASLEALGRAAELRAWQDPRSAEAEELWLRLVRQYRNRCQT